MCVRVLFFFILVVYETGMLIMKMAKGKKSGMSLSGFGR